MKDVYILGAGGLGRKVFECLRRLDVENRKWNIKGFLDDNEFALDNIKCNLSIVGKMSDYIPKEDDVFVLGVSEPSVKEKIVNKFKEKGADFLSIISPEAIVGDFVEVGEGSIIMTPYNIETGSKIGSFVTILGSTIAIDGSIGDYSTSTGFVNLTNAQIGSKVFIGTHAVILENVKVGNGSKISAGTIVTNDVPDNVLVFGNPGRIIKRIGD